MNIKTRISSNHKDHNQLHREFDEARKKVAVSGMYSHYKYPENTYEVINLGFIEATDDVCVIYRATYDKDLIFVRPLDSWLDVLELEGGKIPRFKLKN